MIHNKVRGIVIAAASLVASTGTSSALTVYGLGVGGTSLLSFDTATPGTLSGPTSITGLLGGETILAIDFRNSNELLHGYSSSNRLYSINFSTGLSTLVSTFPTVSIPATNMIGSDVASAFPPTGVVSVDYNPTADGSTGALRIIDTNENNLRYVHSSNTLFRDDTLTPGNPSIVGAAYTNNDVNPGTGTSLFVLNGADSSLYLQNPANDGVLSLVGTGLGFTLSDTNVGFDVPLGGTSNAFASFNDTFFSVNLTTGTATSIGTIGTAAGTDVIDIAIIPEPATTGMLLIGAAGLCAVRRRQRN